MHILPATIADIPALLALVNSAFRGDSARQGWTHESDLIAGDARTDERSLRTLLSESDVLILKYLDTEGNIVGCVNLTKKPRGLYLGMLTVAPHLQGAGIGKHLLAYADAYARQEHLPCIYMTVFSVRGELIAWYERHGYVLTGETEPYPSDDRYGVPRQTLEFVVLEKKVAF
jgi:ribosomal protein S18 acetylase RimI-like enzyme